jgi:hypothetical protein
MPNGNQIIYRLLSVAIFGCLLAVGCATSQKEYGKLEKAEDDTKLNISFSVESVDYQRTVSEINHTGTGWVENGTWQASGDAGIAEVNIYIATLYDGKAFEKKSVKEMRGLVRALSGQSNLDIGEQGEVTTNSGPIEYVFYRTGARACVSIRKYWSDPELQGDINSYIGFSWVAGTSFIFATDCRPGGEDLQLTDLNLLFNGITAKNLYWPGNMFVSVDGTFGGKTGAIKEPLGFDVSGISDQI